MKTISSRLLAILAVAVFGLTLSACDSDDPVDCAITPNDPSCPGTPPAVNPNCFVYDTTGTEIRVTDVVLDEGTATERLSGVAPGGDNTITWTNDFTYILTNKAFVNDGQTLIIEEGTVIKGEPGIRENATALVVARGGRIEARGTSANPIIFTALADDVNDSSDEPGPGSWGGVIILGTATTNTTPGFLQIEGIPTTEPRGAYGCGDTYACDDGDDSGVFQYVSIRYGGAEIGADNEINGLTLGGVGNSTTVSHVEVIANLDDGIEFFGGTVDTKYMVAAFCGDESFDTDQGYRGRGQFWFAIQGEGRGDNGAEMDGGDGGAGEETAQPYSTPVIWNATFIGTGMASSDHALRIKENSAPSFYRSYFTAFGDGITVEDNDSGEDSRNRLGDELILRDILWGDFVVDADENGTFNEPVDVAPEDYVLAYLQANGSRFIGTDSAVENISRERNGLLNPTATGPALTDLGSAPSGGFFDNAACIGAVCPGNNWLQGWTALSQLGYLAN